MGFLGKLLGTDKAAKRMTQAYGLSSAEIKARLADFRRDLAPYMGAGEFGINELLRMLREGPGEFEASPGYGFRVGEGTKALERGAAAKGLQFSGRQAKALTRFGQDYASGEYQNFLNRYYRKLQPYGNLAGSGQQAATTLGHAGMQTGQMVGQNILGAGQARAWGATAVPSFMGQMAGQGMNALAMYYGMGAGGGGGGQFSPRQWYT